MKNLHITDSFEGRDLPGFTKKSFSLNYNGGEIWFEHLDGIYGHTSLASEKLSFDIPKFTRPSSPSLIAFVLDETSVDGVLTEQIVKSLPIRKKDL